MLYYWRNPIISQINRFCRFNVAATSIHKSQGLTLDYVVVDLGPSIFSPSMAYVALSRVKCLEGLFLSSYLRKKIYINHTVSDFCDEMQNNEIKIFE